MDQNNFKLLLSTLTAASKAVGLRPEQVRTIGPGVVTLGDTGVSVFWTSDGVNGQSGWLVRETYQLAVDNDEWRPVSQTVVVVAEAEYVRVAKCALLLISERRLDSFLNRAVS